MLKNNPQTAILPLFLILFIDGMGLSLLFPVLNSIIIDPHSTFLPASFSLGTRAFIYGLIIGIFNICWFFGAAVLGDLSDSVGRKKSLMICLIGACLGYLLSAVAVVAQSLGTLIAGRIIAGFTAGSQPIAQAAIVDISPPSRKARNLGIIVLAISLGFILGPLFGGILSDNQLVSWFDFSIPLYFAAFISLLNALLLWKLFHETLPRTGIIRIRLKHAIDIFISAFQHKKVRALSVVFFVMVLGWGNFFTFLSLFALERYDFTPLQVSLLLADLGIGFSIGSGYLVDRLGRRFSLHKITVLGFLFTALGITLPLIFHNIVLLWLVMAPVGATISVGYASILAIFSNQVSPDEQGWVMGVTGAIGAVCFGFNSFVTGYLVNFGAEVPMYLAIIGISLSALLMFFIGENHD